MDTHEGTTAPDAPPDVATPALPWEVWAFAWSFVVGQVLSLAHSGVKEDGDWLVSSLVGAALVTFFAHGVLRSRRVRVGVVVVLLVVAAIAELVAVVQEPDRWAVAALVLTATQLHLLNAYVDSPWYRWHREHAGRGGPPVTAVLLLAVLVGFLAGVIDSDREGVSVDLHISF